MLSQTAVAGHPLPQLLLGDLEELASWDNNAYLTWERNEPLEQFQGIPWFRVFFSGDGTQFGLRLEFAIPIWMNARGVSAILPARLELTACTPGELAVVDYGLHPPGALLAALPGVARTCARLLNELWGPTDVTDIFLPTMEYQAVLHPTPFPSLRPA